MVVRGQLLRVCSLLLPCESLVADTVTLKSNSGCQSWWRAVTLGAILLAWPFFFFFCALFHVSERGSCYVALTILVLFI